MTTTTKPESMALALSIAESISAGFGSWVVVETRSGSFQLRWSHGTRSAMINLLVEPCRMNYGEAGMPYQVWRRNDYQNWATLNEAVVDAVKL